MTIKTNRAAAKAYAAEQHRMRAEESAKANVAHDLAKLDDLRRFLIFGKKTSVPADALIAAIDDYAEKLTGDRTALHMKDFRALPSPFKKD